MTAAVAEGNVGAGAGATVGKMGMGRSMKGGLGSAAIALPNGLVVAAIVAVNAVGDIIDPTTGKIVAGVRSEDGKSLADVRKLLRSGALHAAAPRREPGENTTIGLVATNARLTKAEVNRVALMADDGFAQGDYAVAHGRRRRHGVRAGHRTLGRRGEPRRSIGALAAEAMAEAIVRAVSQAESLERRAVGARAGHGARADQVSDAASHRSARVRAPIAHGRRWRCCAPAHRSRAVGEAGDAARRRGRRRAAAAAPSSGAAPIGRRGCSSSTRRPRAFANASRVRGPAALETTDFTARVVLTDLPPGQRIFYRVRFQDLADIRVVERAR